MRLLLIGLGGAVGSVLRYLLSGLVQEGAGATAFPIGTLAVNLLGCFAIGVLTELSESREVLNAETRDCWWWASSGGLPRFQPSRMRP